MMTPEESAQLTLEIISKGRATARTLAEIVAMAIRNDRARIAQEIKERQRNTHEKGCRPDPAHPGWWICTEPGHVPNGHHEEMTQ